MIWIKVYNYCFHQRDSIITTDKPFVNADNGSIGSSHCTCFYRKDNKSSYFDSFVGQLETHLSEQLRKTITFDKYKL